jgi:hypothetical protein
MRSEPWPEINLENVPMNPIGACGDDCSICPRYIATIGNDTNELERVKNLWVSLGLRGPNIDAEDLKCFGCRSENTCAYQDVRDCAFGKKLENCGMCPKYPCKKVNAAFAKTEKAFRSFKGIGAQEEMDSITRAFRYKKMILDGIHRELFK